MPLRGGRWPVMDPASRNLWWNQRGEEQAQAEQGGGPDFLTNGLATTDAQDLGASAGRMYWYPSPAKRFKVKEIRVWCQTSSAGAELAVALYSFDEKTNEFNLVPQSEATFDGSSTGIKKKTFTGDQGPVLEPNKAYMMATMSNNSTVRWRGIGAFDFLASHYDIGYNSDYSFPSSVRLDSGSLTESNVGFATMVLVTDQGTRYI